MPDQAPILTGDVAEVASVPLDTLGWRRLFLRADAAWRLGPRPVALFLAHRASLAAGLPQWRLRGAAEPRGPFLPRAVAGDDLRLTRGETLRLLAAAGAVEVAPDWHGSFAPAAHALSLTLHHAAGARPVWEASRLGALPLLALAARLDPGGPHLARAEVLLAGWCAANPPFRGVNWACGQEAALRALHLALALALLDADRDPPAGARSLLELHAQRIGATPLYALAQDNNHPISEAAGAFACALLLGRPTRRHAAALSARVARLVAPDGGFAQVSPGYTRLLLDVLSVVEWLRRRHGAPPFSAPLAARAAAAATWLGRMTCPETGGTPPLGVEDGSCFADLALCGPADARGSVERALRLFAGSSPRPRAEGWRAASGTLTWVSGNTLALLRTGPLRFRPAQSDLLHLSLRDGADWLLRDGGTGSYDPPAEWWWSALAGAAAHNAAVFDDTEPMPRAGRFLLARWPRLTSLPDGAAARHTNGNRHARRVAVSSRLWTVEDRLSGRFHRVAFHWRLRPAAWRLADTGVTSNAASIAVTADAPLRLSLHAGWESPAYGHLAPVPVLRVEADAPVSVVTTRIHLPPN